MRKRLWYEKGKKQLSYACELRSLAKHDIKTGRNMIINKRVVALLEAKILNTFVIVPSSHFVTFAARTSLSTRSNGIHRVRHSRARFVRAGRLPESVRPMLPAERAAGSFSDRQCAGDYEERL